jgi:hypothetical protein
MCVRSMHSTKYYEINSKLLNIHVGKVLIFLLETAICVCGSSASYKHINASYAKTAQHAYNTQMVNV